jgi:hypothetical protein
MPEVVIQLDRCSNTFPRVQVHVPFSLIWVPADRTSSHWITSKIKISSNFTNTLKFGCHEQSDTT